MIIRPTDHVTSEELGGKASALAKLDQPWCRVPGWFVVTATGEYSVDAVMEAVHSLDATTFAVRSSARGEDGSENSFAGQYSTYLNVKPDQVIERVEQVHRSGDSEHLKAYQGSRAIAETHAPSAIVQKMLRPQVSGVAFSADPVNGARDVAVISALWGLGSALVSGEADADLWRISLEGEIHEEQLADKAIQHVPDSDSEEGVRAEQVGPQLRRMPSLSSGQIREVAELARACERHFGSPQDIEWAIEDGVLYLLQSRPITNLPADAQSKEPLVIWDNSNIAESYSGITSPLTFSFAERIYEHAYREFCKLLAVPQKVIDQNDQVFCQMLGHIRGHVYYNLNSWYRVLAMLPGFSMNRGFMEQMMGVKVPMPNEIVDEIVASTRQGKVDDALAVCRTLGGLVRNYRALPSQTILFHRRLEKALSSNENPLENMSGRELVDHYFELESQLLKRWDAPLVNDFFAMIFCGLLGSLCEKWLGDRSLQNELLLDSGDIISAEPPRRIKVMAEMAARDHELVAALNDRDTDTAVKLRALRERPELAEAFDQYLADFGDRCLEELKLESPSVTDDPHSLLSGIGSMAARIVKGPVRVVEDENQPNSVDEGEALRGLKGRIFRWVRDQARLRVMNRENLRFERTRLFGRVRQIMVQLGFRLQSERRLKEPTDVFYLKLAELLSAFEDGKTEDFRDRVEKRITREAGFTAPPDRFASRGEITDRTVLEELSSEAIVTEGELKGTGACPGVVRGLVRVVENPRNATILEGEILVAQQTDPGWVVLFPAASGLLVERGSLLSHSAIVSRELQLPCIVSVPNVTSRLKTGDEVEMNGRTGQIKIITKVP